MTRVRQSSGLMTDKMLAIINLQPTMSCRINFFLFNLINSGVGRSVQSFLKNGRAKRDIANGRYQCGCWRSWQRRIWGTSNKVVHQLCQKLYGGVPVLLQELPFPGLHAIDKSISLVLPFWQLFVFACKRFARLGPN
jgi:hypothetical protein